VKQTAAIASTVPVAVTTPKATPKAKPVKKTGKMKQLKYQQIFLFTTFLSY
jgi:hypothetical protein